MPIAIGSGMPIEFVEIKGIKVAWSNVSQNWGWISVDHNQPPSLRYTVMAGPLAGRMPSRDWMWVSRSYMWQYIQACHHMAQIEDKNEAWSFTPLLDKAELHLVVDHHGPHTIEWNSAKKRWYDVVTGKRVNLKYCTLYTGSRILC